MKTIKTVSLVAFLLCFTLNLRAQSGTCGANLTWELTDSTLTISGSGAMDNSHPWSSYSSQIARVSLPEGLTNICDNAFYAAKYWVATDYMNKAKAADEALADDANNYIRQYAAYYPQTAEAFMYDVTDGQSYTVSCGGMRATTTVRTQK